ncbi:MAG TPA: hypothetical protein DCW43_07350, partial [Clostridiales bacterium]|nr:hypothetical protein [Clostridiales bacterium]
MQGILGLLDTKETWEEFLGYKLSNRYLSRKEKSEVSSYVEEKRYLSVSAGFPEKPYLLDLPMRRDINKSGTSRKRTVFTFSDDENMYLKALGYLLYRYDGKLSPRCYSFRRSVSARDAIFDILSQKDRDSLYCFKADISNYFNSIPAESLVNVLKEVITDDPDLLHFLSV